MKGKKTVKLSGRPPVTFLEKDWPVTAKASDFSGGSGHACQANEEAWIRVRRHADGRYLVYGQRDSGPGGTPLGYRGVCAGELVEAGDDVVDAIHSVVEEFGEGWEQLAAECINSLPAEEI